MNFPTPDKYQFPERPQYMSVPGYRFGITLNGDYREILIQSMIDDFAKGFSNFHNAMQDFQLTSRMRTREEQQRLMGKMFHGELTEQETDWLALHATMEQAHMSRIMRIRQRQHMEQNVIYHSLHQTPARISNYTKGIIRFHLPKDRMQTFTFYPKNSLWTKIKRFFSDLI